METVINSETTAVANFTALKQKVDRVLALDKITAKDIEDFSPLEREYLAETCTATVKQLKDEARDSFLNQIDLVIPASTKSDIWGYNHTAISIAVSELMCKHGIMPTKNAIAKQTGLSRQTVAKHFEAHNKRPEFTAELEQFKFMAPRLLANVFKFALNGDMRAARLYFETVGAVNKMQTITVVNEQTNYIQINNTILSQETLKHLTADQLNQIESIIRDKGGKRIL